MNTDTEEKDKMEEIEKCESELDSLVVRCGSLTKNHTGMTESKERRACYATVELLGIRAQALSRTGKWSDAQKKRLEDIATKTRDLSASVALLHVRRKLSSLGVVIDKIDELLRLVAVWSFLIVSSIVIVLPCLLLSPVDFILGQLKLVDPRYQISVLCKRFISIVIVKLSGISLVVEQKNMDSFGKECCVVCFSHSSTLDAFILAAVTPVRHYTLGKAELFLIPFFSWCLLAFGAIPIERNNRDQAIKAVGAACASANVGDCVAIAPEGTRSKTGQILAFKKGPFYMWDQLKTPIIPLVTFGAFELYPPGRQMSMPGKVYAEFLCPIQNTEAKTREEMSELVRIRMLECWRDGPEDVCAPLTWLQRLEQQFFQYAYFFSVYQSMQLIPFTELLETFKIGKIQAFGLFLAVSFGITFVFYFYLMYVSFWIASFREYLLKNRRNKAN